MTSIDLGDCETLLKNDYNISGNETIYMKKIGIFQKGIKIPKVEYDVYCRLKGTNLIKLNLTACSNSKISIYVPIEISKNVDEFNSSSGYYNDICYTTTSEDGTDISLKDRQKKYIDEDKVVCQEDCDFSEYYFDSLIAKCSCDAKESEPSFADMAFNKSKIILDNFKDIKNFVNFNFLLCHKKLFNKAGLVNNIGAYVLIIIILIYIISIFIFCINQFSLLKKKIKDLVFGIKGKQIIDLNAKRKKKEIKSRTKNHKKANLFEKSESKKMIASKKNNKNIFPKKNINNKSNKRNIANIHIHNINNIIYNINNNKIKKNYSNNLTTNIVRKINNKRSFNINCNRQSNIKKLKNIMEYIDEEINILPYNLAIQYDKRNYCNYYISLLKTKHNLIFSLNNNDYNSRIIKINLFLIGFTIKYVVNGLFFNDDTMHKIYEKKGQFDLEVQIPIIVYSSLISTLLNTPLNLLALSNNDIISFKQNKSTINLMKRAEDLTNKLTIKFILYFIISFLLLVFFWYYIAMFGVIYRNTQIHLLKDTLMSFGLSLIIPFGLYLIPGFFRIPSLSNRRNKREYLYNFSKVLQLI